MTLFDNQFPERLDDELQIAHDMGIEAADIGDARFDEYINAGTVKWVVTKEGIVRVIPHTFEGVELNHTVAAKGKPVLAAGEVEIAGSEGIYFGLSINNHSGHYLPDAASLEIALSKFAEANIVFAPESIERLE